MVANECSLGDIYIRYLSYNTAELLKADLVKRLPIKIDIGAREATAGCICRAAPSAQRFCHVCTGAVYSTPPKDRAFNGDMFFPVERELVSAIFFCFCFRRSAAVRPHSGL